MKTPIIQLCGPIGCGKLPTMEQLSEANALFSKFSKRLQAMGYLVINPMRFDFLPGTTYAAMLQLCVDSIFNNADILLMLPGWEESQGACTEWQTGISKQIPIYTSDEIYISILNENAMQLGIHPHTKVCQKCKGKGVETVAVGFLGDPLIVKCDCHSKKSNQLNY